MATIVHSTKWPAHQAIQYHWILYGLPYRKYYQCMNHLKFNTRFLLMTTKCSPLRWATHAKLGRECIMYILANCLWHLLLKTEYLECANHSDGQHSKQLVYKDLSQCYTQCFFHTTPIVTHEKLPFMVQYVCIPTMYYKAHSDP